MITIAVEKLNQYWDDIQPLLILHWQEVAAYKDVRPLAPMQALYRDIEARGKLFSIVARDQGKIVAYSVFFINEHLHYEAWRVASNDVIFTLRDYRSQKINGKPLGLFLIDESERQLELAGIDEISWHIKKANDWSAILKRKKYGIGDTIWTKVLHGLTD